MVLSAFQSLRERRYLRRIMNEAFSGKREGLNDIEAFLHENFQPINAPLVLISQVQRSGGTLLSQLFDGHPQLAAHPDEFRIGYPTEEDWPPVDPALEADANFRMLFVAKNSRKVSRGYAKGNRGASVHPFFLVPRVQYNLFRHLFKKAPPKTARDVLDLYFTSYFNAWLNYAGGLDAKRWITAFAPRMADNPATVAGLFRDYPEGRLIQILRDPASWYPSARKHRTTRFAGKSAEEVLHKWVFSAQAMIRNKSVHGHKVIILRFEDLVGATEPTMKRLSEELGIGFESILTRPTYIGQTMWANSSFSVRSSGVIAAPLERDTMLSNDERVMTERLCRGTYDDAQRLALDIKR